MTPESAFWHASTNTPIPAIDPDDLARLTCPVCAHPATVCTWLADAYRQEMRRHPRSCLIPLDWNTHPRHAGRLGQWVDALLTPRHA